MSEVVVEVEQLTKVYTGDGVATHALRGLSFQIKRGEFVAIMGPSGCGKSTLLNLIGALDRPTSGRVLIDGSILGVNDVRGVARVDEVQEDSKG